MKFNAQTAAAEPLEYDFTSWGVDAKGSVPEPTREAMSTFLEFYDKIFGESQTAREEALRAQVNEMQRQQEAAGKVVIEGDLPGADVVEEPEPEPVKPSRRSVRDLILGSDEAARQFSDAVAGLCQQKPSADEIWSLPQRIRMAFIDAAIGLFINGNSGE
jgi:hypothetical protein